jgi:lipoprotein-releasing system ATP-binding protein
MSDAASTSDPESPPPARLQNAGASGSQDANASGSQNASASGEEVLRLADLRKSYGVGRPTEAEVLHGIDFAVNRGEFVALVGPSGSGKSTLLNLIGLLDAPTSGELYLLGRPTRSLDDAARTSLRRDAIGFVFQFHHLIQAFSALENVLMPSMLARGKPTPEILDRARALLADVGLETLADRKPNELSGGQQQRVAIARALLLRPPLLLADEPTGNLDSRTAAGVFRLFRHFNASYGCAVLLVTHDPRMSEASDRTLNLVDGRIVH